MKGVAKSNGGRSHNEGDVRTVLKFFQELTEKYSGFEYVRVETRIYIIVISLILIMVLHVNLLFASTMCMISSTERGEQYSVKFACNVPVQLYTCMYMYMYNVFVLVIITCPCVGYLTRVSSIL